MEGENQGSVQMEDGSMMWEKKVEQEKKILIDPEKIVVAVAAAATFASTRAATTGAAPTCRLAHRWWSLWGKRAGTMWRSK